MLAFGSQKAQLTQDLGGEMAYKTICCPVCGSQYYHTDNNGNYVCDSCKTTFADDTTLGDIIFVSNMLDGVQFEAAENICRDRLADNPDNPELNWLMFLAKNKVHFVRDSASGERKPVFYGNSFFRSDCSVYDDVNYTRSLLGRYAQRYRHYGELVEAIRMELWEKVSGEYDTDIFVSFKAEEEMTDSDGNVRKVPTYDSKKAEEIYTYFTARGYKVFFSPVSIGRGNVLGEKYEPKIFGALASAKAMVLVGTKSAYVNSGWVRDEWTRYLYFMDNVNVRSTSRLKKGANTLFYVYDRVAPADLPSQISEIQGVDCSSVGYLDELYRALHAKIGNPSNGIERVAFAQGQTVRKQHADVEQIATVALGTGVVGKKKVVQADALQIKEFGTNRVDEYNADAQKIIDGAFASLAVGNFKFAEHEFDEVLSAADNATALAGKLLIAVGARNDEEFVANAERILPEHIQLFNRLMSCADNTEANRAADLFVAACKHCCNNVHVGAALLYFNAVCGYNIPQRTEAIETVKAVVPSLVQAHNSDVTQAADAVLSCIDPKNVDERIDYCLQVTATAVDSGSFAVAETYNDKVLAMDDQNHSALFNRLYITTNTRNDKQLADKALSLSSADIAYVVEHSSAKDAQRDILFFVKAYLAAMQGSNFTAAANRVKAMLVYDFTGRAQAVDDFVKGIVDNGADSLSEQEFADIVDYAAKLIDGNAVDKHIALYNAAADKARAKGWLATAENLYKRVVDLDNGNVQALSGALYASVGSADGNIAGCVDKFADKNGNAVANLENLLRFAMYNNDADKEYSFDTLVKRFCNDILQALWIGNVDPETADKAYLNVVRYIPVDNNALMVDRLYAMGRMLLIIQKFALADKYFAEIVSIDEHNFDALWGRVLAENECANDEGLSQILTDYTETQTYIRAYREADVKTQQQLNKRYADWTVTLEQRQHEAAIAEQKRLEEERLAEEKRLAAEAAQKAEQRDNRLIAELLAAVGAKDFGEVVYYGHYGSEYEAILSKASQLTVEKIKLLKEMADFYFDCRCDRSYFQKYRKYGKIKKN